MFVACYMYLTFLFPFVSLYVFVLTSLVRSWSLSLVYCVIAGGVTNGDLHKRKSIPSTNDSNKEHCTAVYVTLYGHVDPHHVFSLH